jgi:diguanylate cyclase (GGDEF)-like protein
MFRPLPTMRVVVTSHLIPDRRRAAAVTPWAVIACLGIIAVGQPVGRHGGLELALGTATTLGAIAALLWAPRPRSTTVALVLPALIYLVAVVLLRDATGGSRGGMNPLVLLAPFAVALHGSRRQLLCVIGGLVLVFIGPLLLIGGQAYPLTGLRSALLLGSIATIVGLSIQALVASLRDREAEREELLARLREQAATDELTGLANLRGWNRGLATGLARARRTGEPVAVALLDLDRFKAINDTRGHAAGDALLRAVATALEDELRPGDVLARIGGDEFGLLLPGCSAQVAAATAERLATALPDGHTFSAGVAEWDGIETPQELAERADSALYSAKAGGRDQVCAAGDEARSVTSSHRWAQLSAPSGRSEAI